MRIAAPLLGTALALGSLTTQALIAQGSPVVISEVNFSQQPGSSDNQWIELYNLSGNAVDVSAWSIYHATKTPFHPQAYWWGFPANTLIPANSFLRIHWREPIPGGNPVAGQLFTGSTVFNFLFGNGSEPLSAASGALALVQTQNNALMNTPASYVDWVSWGDTGFAREDLAIQNLRWTAGAFVPSPVNRESIAVAVAQAGLPTPVTAWFRDASPTPSARNAESAGLVATFGTGTRLSTQLLQVPLLQGTNSPTAAGNVDQVLSVDGTAGLPGETVFLVFSEGSLATPLPIANLDIFIDPAQVVLDLPGAPGALGTTRLFDFSVVPNTVPGMTFYAQAVLFNLSTLEILGSSNAVQFTMGL